MENAEGLRSAPRLGFTTHTWKTFPYIPKGSIGMSDLLQAAVGDTYRIEDELGGGGMSRVFVAEEVELGRQGSSRPGCVTLGDATSRSESKTPFGKTEHGRTDQCQRRCQTGVP